MKRVYVDLSGGRRLGHVVKDNYHTVWVKILIGATTFITIKRHWNKHNVLFSRRYLREEVNEDMDEYYDYYTDDTLYETDINGGPGLHH